MTSFWLFLSKMFLASYKFYDAFAYELNWVLFIVGSGFFLYWCSVLIFELAVTDRVIYNWSLWVSESSNIN